MDNAEKFPSTSRPEKPNTHVNAVIKGKGNSVSDSAINVIVFGSNNIVGEGCENVSIFNSTGCVVQPGVRGVTIHNSSGVVAAIDDQSFNHGSLTAGKIYKALLTQAGTSAPTAFEFENSIGPVTFARDGVGQYRLISANHSFTSNKTFAYPASTFNLTGGTTSKTEAYLLSDHEIYLYSYDSSNVYSDGWMNREIIIEIYP